MCKRIISGRFVTIIGHKCIGFYIIKIAKKVVKLTSDSNKVITFASP